MEENNKNHEEYSNRDIINEIKKLEAAKKSQLGNVLTLFISLLCGLLSASYFAFVTSYFDKSSTIYVSLMVFLVSSCIVFAFLWIIMARNQ